MCVASSCEPHHNDRSWCGTRTCCCFLLVTTLVLAMVSVPIVIIDRTNCAHAGECYLHYVHNHGGNWKVPRNCDWGPLRKDKCRDAQLDHKEVDPFYISCSRSYCQFPSKTDVNGVARVAIFSVVLIILLVFLVLATTGCSRDDEPRRRRHYYYSRQRGYCRCKGDDDDEGGEKDEMGEGGSAKSMEAAEASALRI